MKETTVWLDKISLSRMTSEEVTTYLQSEGLDTEQPYSRWESPTKHNSQGYRGIALSDEATKPKKNKMKREDVYKLIDGEREYQKKWDAQRIEKGLPTRDKYATVESWILWMEDYLTRARTAATNDTDKTTALEHIRKVTALGVACMENNDTSARNKE